MRARSFRARAILTGSILDEIAGVTRSVHDFHSSRCDRVVAAVLARIRIGRA